MAALHFSILPDAIGRLYELLLCLSKFGEYVSLEARSEKLTITALNLSRTAYAAFLLDANDFFISYNFNVTDPRSTADRFTCQLLNKALQSVFKGRTSDVRGRESIVERCDVIIDDQPDTTECRLVVKLLCKHGMTKTFKLTYESAEVMHALFDRASVNQGWRISARVLREYIEFFDPRTEQLDILAEGEKVRFTSFTEKVSDGKAVLKQPLETAIAIHTQDFTDFRMQEDMHVIISVKDFKAIVTHAETLRATISADFSYPGRPLQFSYQNFGITCEFTLMTTGEYNGTIPTTGPGTSSARSSSKQPSFSTNHTSTPNRSVMPPPARPSFDSSTSGRNSRPSLRSQVQRPPSRSETSPDPESLFVSRNDADDQRWDAADDQTLGDEETLGWDANNEHPSASLYQTFRDSETSRAPTQRESNEPRIGSEDLEPTQRLSQLHGLFD